MNHEDLFTAALMLKEPLYVSRIEFDKGNGELHIYIDFRKGSKFTCPICLTDGCSVHDTIEKTWRHLNFFQYKAYIHYRNPRYDCPVHGIHLAEAPWGAQGTGFTLLFEAMILQMAKYMAVAQIADIVDEHDSRLWRVIKRHVGEAHAVADYSNLVSVGLDETSSKKGHHYVTLFVDMAESKVVFVTEGKGADTLADFKTELPAHNCNPGQIEDISVDMSPAFRKGCEESFPWATVTYDKFHVIKLMNEAVDQVRREEQKTNPSLKSSRYLWLHNRNTLGKKDEGKLESLISSNCKTAKAYQLKLTLQDVYRSSIDKNEAMGKLAKFYSWAVRCRLEPVKAFAKTLKKHWSGILNYFDSRLTNAVLEGINSLVQSAKSRARGFRNVNNLITMIYLLAGKLTFNFQYQQRLLAELGQPT
jgi:transposase